MREDIYLLLQTLADKVQELFPRILMALLVLIVGYLLGKIVKRLVKRLLLYLDKKANDLLQIRMVNIDLKASATFISRLCFWVIISITLLICVQVLGLDFSKAVWFGTIIEYLPNIFIAIIIILVGIITGRLLGDLIRVAASRTGTVNGNYLRRMVRYLVLFVSIIIALDQLGVDIAFLKDVIIVILGGLLFAASLAFGLGAQDSVSNILGTYYVRKTHQIGTRIKMNEIEGVIIKIADHAVSLETANGVVIIPSKKFSENSVTIIEDQNG